MALAPASGIGTYASHTRKIIRFVRHGCTNREFFHIVVAEVNHPIDSLRFAPSASSNIFGFFLLLQTYKEQYQPVIEQLGSYDPMPNERNEKYLAFNFERIRYWLGQGADISRPVAEILGKHST